MTIDELRQSYLCVIARPSAKAQQVFPDRRITIETVIGATEVWFSVEPVDEAAARLTLHYDPELPGLKDVPEDQRPCFAMSYEVDVEEYTGILFRVAQQQGDQRLSLL